MFVRTVFVNTYKGTCIHVVKEVPYHNSYINGSTSIYVEVESIYNGLMTGFNQYGYI